MLQFLDTAPNAQFDYMNKFKQFRQYKANSHRHSEFSSTPASTKNALKIVHNEAHHME